MAIVTNFQVSRDLIAWPFSMHYGLHLHLVKTDFITTDNLESQPYDSSVRNPSSQSHRQPSKQMPRLLKETQITRSSRTRKPAHET